MLKQAADSITNKGRTSGFVLLVEGERFTRDMLRRALMREGIAVLSAATASTAEKFLHVYKTDIRLVILDLAARTASSLEFARHLAARHSAPAILYIASGESCLALDAIRRMRPAAVLKKPFKAKTFVARVEEQMARLQGPGSKTA